MLNEKISLCAITGNCEGIIGSFIEQFRPLVDEICIVRALGKNQKHDRSLSIALSKGCRVGEFQGEREDWPHTHDFSAARNVVWDMAHYEWVMWADIDDNIDEQSIKEFRRLVTEAPENVSMIQAPYIVPDQGIFENIRERIMRRGKFKWTMPVHECAKSIDGQKYDFIETRKAAITHNAKSDRKPSCERNIRILEAIPENERAGGHLFYLFSEYYGIGREQDAIAAAKAFMKHPEAGESERYEVLIILATISHDPAEKAALLHEAHRTSPQRVEALYELTNLELTFGNLERAQSYCRQMRSLPKPARNAWNIRRKFYGWEGESLEFSVHRVCGRPKHAEALEFNRFKAAGGKITLLHATRGRPIQAIRARLSWLDTATNPSAIEHIFAIDVDDVHSQCLRRFKHVLVSGEGACVEAWNVAAYHANGDVFIQMSDDWIPPAAWDQLILDRLGDLSEPKVLAVSDGHRKDDLICMAILTRARWIQQSKALFHPDFKGVFSDNWFSRQAFNDGIVIDAKDLVFHHCHPLFGTAENDETYAKQNSPERYENGQRIYQQLVSAEGRTIFTHCSVRLGDNLTHLQFLRKLARRYPSTRFVHCAHSNYLPQLRDVIADLGNIELLGFSTGENEEWRQIDPPHEGSLEAWKNDKGFWETHPLKNDFVGFYIAWFDELAKRMGLENPIKRREHLIFDYPALVRTTPLDGPFDFLIINSPPLSGQLQGYSNLSTTAKLLTEKGFSVITTCPIEGYRCTQDANMSVTDIGSLSRQCRHIIMVSTGPSWPTFNIFNVSTVELRIIILDNEKIEISSNTVHVQNEYQVIEILKQKGLL